MFTRLLQALGWVTKEEREGRRIDYGSSLCVTGIRNKSEFLVNMLDLVPDGSVWSIEGIHDEQILADLAPYRTTDDVRVIKATVWPRQTQIKVLLNTESKPGIIELLPAWDLNLNFIHQHIYYGEDFLLTSHDNLADGITYLSPALDRSRLDSLAQAGLFTFVETQSDSPATS